MIFVRVSFKVLDGRIRYSNKENFPLDKRHLQHMTHSCDGGVYGGEESAGKAVYLSNRRLINSVNVVRV